MKGSEMLGGALRVFHLAELPGGWQFDLLGNRCTIRRGSSPRPAGDPKYFGHGTIPWIKIGDATKSPGRYLERTEEFVNEEGAKRSVCIPAGSLIIANSGVSLGFATITRVPGCIHDGWLLVSDFKNLDRDYLYYCINLVTKRIRQMADGTTQPNLNTDIARRFLLPMPPILEQKGIATVLGMLDDKIELNQRTSKTLDGIVLALFKSWFVDFDPVRAKEAGRDSGLPKHLDDLFPSSFDSSELGLIPKSWRVKTLGDVTSYLNRGVSPAYVTEGGVLVLNQKCIRDGRVEYSKGRRHDPNERSIERRTLMPGDVLVNSTGVGTLGRVAQVIDLDEDTIVDSHVTVVRSNGVDSTSNFLGIALRAQESDIEALGEGSTGQTELSRFRLASLPVIVSPPQLLAEFDRLCVPIRRCAAANEKTSLILSDMRDALLPRLISGQLRIVDVERILGGQKP